MQYFDQMQDVMIRSGQLVMQYFRQDISIIRKADGSLATNADIENELFLKQELLKIMPQAGFIAEESGCENEQFDFVWVIDPLDGTKNFIKGIPHFCICIALTFRGNPIVGAIYNPVSKDFYYAEKGYGAWLNGTHTLSMRDKKFENDGIIMVIDDINLQKLKSQPKTQEMFEKMHISNRYFGSVGLDTAYLAAGYIELVEFKDIAWWDIAAGMLLIEQAGGLVNWSKKPGDVGLYGNFKAGHPWIYQQFT